jgi:hypothetical protein
LLPMLGAMQCFIFQPRLIKNLRAKRHHQADAISHLWRHQYQSNIRIKYHSSCSIKRDAAGSESALRSLSQPICRSRANDIRGGQASRLHQYPIDSDFNSGHVKDPHFTYDSRELCNQEGYQS